MKFFYLLLFLSIVHFSTFAHYLIATAMLQAYLRAIPKRYLGLVDST
jgi:threonine/homoserine/homoserine lactone efflux protein